MMKYIKQNLSIKGYEMYILINYIKNPIGKKCTMAFDNFADLKDSCVVRLNNSGWYDKDRVDLRSADSCVKYLFDDHRSINYKFSKSRKKYLDYRYGRQACMP